MESTLVAQRAHDLVVQMTLEEKIGQLTQIGQHVPDPVAIDERIRNGQVGSILWLSDTHEINRLQHLAVEESRLHIPLLFGLDVIHGYSTIFPPPLAMAASFDPDLVEQAQAVAAREARAAGINWTFAPMVDIARDARWGRIVEGAGEDPYLGAAMARAQVRGFQGAELGGADRVLACAKHFAGYGAAEGGRDYDSAYIPEALLRNVYLPPFRAAREAGVGTFMSAYMDLNDVPASANRFLLKRVLRDEWQFEGFVVSDANAVADLVSHGYAPNAAQAALRALTAGVDMDMASRTFLTHLAAWVGHEIPEAAIDDAVYRILATKVALGLFENPYVDESQVQTVFAAPEHRALARRAAARSAVLLRNEGGLLPLDRSAYRSIAVVGPFADSQYDHSTMWASSDVSKVVTIVEGIRARAGSAVAVEYAPGIDPRKVFESMFDTMMRGPKTEPWTESQAENEFNHAVALAQHSDLTILVIGQSSTMSGEYASQASLELPGRQSELVAAVAALGKPVVLILMNGRPLDITATAASVPAILDVWHPGTEGGHAVADLLWGDAVPGGKLPVTWPRSAGQCPLYYAHNLTHQPETNPEFQSRYWDIESSPLYPFGFGLSYTTFAYANLRVSPAVVEGDATLTVAVDVTNTGKRAGDEVVQLYVHQRAGSASRPVRELKGFKRVTLEPGETATVPFTLAPADLQYWSTAAGDWVRESATFDLWVGGDSTATLGTTFQTDFA